MTDENMPSTKETSDGDAGELNGFLQRQAKRVARNPCSHFWVSLLVSIGLSYVALVIGEFEVSVNSGGWQSRGTLIANRQTQLMLMQYNQEYLFSGGNEAWEELTNNVQRGWEDDDDTVEESSRRLGGADASLASKARYPDQAIVERWTEYLKPQADRISVLTSHKSPQRQVPFKMTPDLSRRLQDQKPALEGCDMEWYNSANVTDIRHLWPIWEIQASASTALSPEVIRDICFAEQSTQKVLVENDLCFGCDQGCLPPMSLVLYARLLVPNGMSMTCQDLADAWAPYEETVQEQWTACIQEIKTTYNQENQELPESCPFGFSPVLVDDKFDETSVLVYTSSIFATKEEYEHAEEMYEHIDSFDRGTEFVQGTYDTQWEDFLGMYLDVTLGRDMILAMGSAVAVTLAILVHTRSPFITLVGLLQIILSFPLAYFVYKLVAGLVFFPFLNFIGVFVVFALGADDVFVAVDKWKNARLEHPKASTEYIAALALPDAADAMFLTSSTTAIAFFATAVCPVAPVKMFAIFLGLLITFDYLMCILLVFPALCIYDTSMQTGRGPCARYFFCCFQSPSSREEDRPDGRDDAPSPDADATKPSIIGRILNGYFWILKKARWGVLLASLVAFILCIIGASKLEMPTSSDVRLLKESNHLEQNYLWRNKLLYSSLDKIGGSEANVIWGVKPDDTGDLNDPGTWSQLTLDGKFEPSSKEAQVYLTNFCEGLFSEEFAAKTESNFTCPMNKFDQWLQEQANTTVPDEIYTEKCAGAKSIPVAPENFHSCVIAWSQQAEESFILSNNGKVEIVFLPFASRVRYDNHYDQLDEEWHLIENWMKEQNRRAPLGVNQGYFSSDDFWWYDTNGQMLRSAYSSAGIALIGAAGIILLSSRSLVMTLFATLSIGYVLASVTATLVAMGWTLGFLEAINFSILIGVSVDFVIHFSHAYVSLPGTVDREVRTKHALIHMGPSILAAAFTTVISAIVMLFTVITFFQKFALILFFTIVQATLGSFVVFLAMCVCFGPSNPTYLVDSVVERCFKQKKEQKDKDSVLVKDETERSPDAVVW